MGMGPIIWTCLALTFHQAPVQEFFMKDKGIRLPIRVDLSKANDLRSLILLYSHDQGKTWEQADKKLPTDHEFIYRAPEDGSYWFILQQEDNNGRTNPANPERGKPIYAVIVDTKPPLVKATAERLANGQIHVQWRGSDSYPDSRSLRLEYHTSSLPEGQWTPVAASQVLEGIHDFDPGNDGRTGVVRVRVQLKDQAGNVGEDFCVLPATGAAVAAASAGPAGGSPFTVIPSTRNDTPGQPNHLTSQQTQRPVIEMAPGSLAPPPPSPPAELNASVSGPAQFPGLPVAANAERMQPSSTGNSFDGSANSAAVKIVKAREVRIDFVVGKVGPSGLGNADIYVTLDQGHRWDKMPGEVPITVSQNADGRGPDVVGSVAVQLPAEARAYGFIVAVKSKAGLAPPPPKSGDPPQALVEFDATVPLGQLFKPRPDPNQPNALVLFWEAKDRNLDERPITLEWAEQKGGPWKPIAEGPLPNSGQYPWRLPEGLPPRVYLRMTMRDKAGNEARAQTDNPELIDLSVPQTKIIGVAPASR